MPDEQNQLATSDDQELAKVLAGVSDQQDGVAAEEEIVTTPLPDFTAAPTTDVPTPDPIDPAAPLPPVGTAPEPQVVDATPPIQSLSIGNELDDVKLEALHELRPLVDKLNVSSEEKFDTYLLLLRSTDDKELIMPAHEAAKAIEDETRRAQALLDIIKEIDFLSQNKAA